MSPHLLVQVIRDVRLAQLTAEMLAAQPDLRRGRRDVLGVADDHAGDRLADFAGDRLGSIGRRELGRHRSISDLDSSSSARLAAAVCSIWFSAIFAPPLHLNHAEMGVGFERWFGLRRRDRLLLLLRRRQSLR